jgi:hypothetical protein
MPKPKIISWPQPGHRLAPTDHVHAFGQITLAYNLLQSAMEWMFVFSMPFERDYSKRLFHHLNNRDRIDLLTAHVTKNEKDYLDQILYCILCYDICTENRNILMHVTIHEVDIRDPDTFRLTKSASNDPLKQLDFRVTLSDLRSLADETMGVWFYA